MWHNLDTYKHDNGSMTQTNKLIFPTREIADIGLVDNDGVIVSATVTFKGVNEDREPSYITFKRSTSELASQTVDVLVALAEALVNTPNYFEDEQGNIFPYDKIIYVNATKYGFVMAPGIDISLHPTSEWPRFKDEYRNWMDLHK